MSNELNYIEKVEEMIKANKADDSILNTIKNNENEQKKASENLDVILTEIKNL